MASVHTQVSVYSVDHKPAPSSPEAEPRQLTVMCCGLADSSALSQPLAPEVLRQVVRAYLATTAAIIRVREM